MHINTSHDSCRWCSKNKNWQFVFIILRTILRTTGPIPGLSAFFLFMCGVKLTSNMMTIWILFVLKGKNNQPSAVHTSSRVKYNFIMYQSWMLHLLQTKLNTSLSQHYNFKIIVHFSHKYSPWNVKVCSHQYNHCFL